MFLDSGIHIPSGSVPVGSSLDLFELDPAACLEDLDATLASLKQTLHKEKLLGALMFSCGGRGPGARSMLGREMADARAFDNVFPGLPLLGFYAGGEIGPEARPMSRNPFQSGKVKLQGECANFL